jgi:hypothetical protein
MKDREEDLWVRRHMPATLARIPCAATLQASSKRWTIPTASCAIRRFAALEHLRRTRPDLVILTATVDKLIAAETTRAFNRLTLHYNLFHAGGLDATSCCAGPHREATRGPSTACSLLVSSTRRATSRPCATRS